MRQATLSIHQEEFSFSAGHFTIFSATERECLHGHNYYVSVNFHFCIQQNGLAFDYRLYKKKILAHCEQLDRHLLLPAHSPYLKLEDAGDYWHAYFNQKKMYFLKEDVIILELENITIEELSHWFLTELTIDKSALAAHGIHQITLNVFNGPGQSAGATWSQDNDAT
ncbi:MAG TPA: 6-carboxytetrahydropterin synthase [Gammaproteobacteria bacterium]|nr:6-carboxytetrahydropterin synthase [Gammaproteobacteria bacterium]